MQRRLIYSGLTLGCFLLCYLIVKLFSDNLVIRGLVGDFLVVILIYSLVKVFVDVKPAFLAGATLALAYLTELLQYFKLIRYLGLEDSQIARIIFGAVFDPFDLLAYTVGVICIYLMDKHTFSRIQ